MALAAHFTQVKCGTTTTLETIRFQRPDRIDFRLVRGPLPHLTESLLLTPTGPAASFAGRASLAPISGRSAHGGAEEWRAPGRARSTPPSTRSPPKPNAARGCPMRARRPLVELLHFDGCPNRQAARELVERITSELALEPVLRLIEVADEDAAQRQRSLGSTTVRVDGRDVDPQAQAGAARLRSVLPCLPEPSAASPACPMSAGCATRSDVRRRSEMPTPIDRDEVQRLQRQGAQLVEVLPEPSPSTRTSSCPARSTSR